MANAQRGEVGFEVEGKHYKLAFSANAICDLEGELDLDIDEIGERLKKRIRVTFVRAALWAGLQEHHPEVTVREAGELVGKLTVIVALTKITEAFKLAFPQAAEGETKRPQ